MNKFLNADTLEISGGELKTVSNNNNPPLSYAELMIKCELLEANAAIQERAMGDMSKEICELNNQILDMLDQFKEMR